MSSFTPLDAITLDPELQPRVKINRAVLAEYAQLLVDGAVFPPIIVFNTGEQLLLADGFHRWHVHNALGADTIATEIIDGSRRDALLYSLQANSKHGLTRSQSDFTRAYEIAVRNDLVAGDDPEAVAALLGCSVSRAYELTLEARAEAKAERDAAIVAAKDAGQSNREIARELDVAEGTVRTITAQKFQPGKTTQDDPPDEPSDDAPTWKQQLTELASPPAQNWSAALRALRHVNEQVAVEALFAERYSAFDWTFGPELETAFAWINELHQRFNDAGNQRRCA
jgi:ParB-like chromosome segregation protein Spo0J